MRGSQEGSNPVAEVGSFIPHPPQLLISVPRPTILPSSFREGVPLRVDPFIGRHQDRQRNEPHAYKAQLDSIHGGCQTVRDWVDLALTSKPVSRGIFSPEDVGWDDPANVPDADIEG